LQTTRTALELGTAIGGYVVERLLGRGAMGDVYLARDLALNRPVALKVLPAGAAGDQRRRERLQFEGRVLRALRHPNICSVYGVGEENGLAFIAMEYIEGRTLHEISTSERMPLDGVVRIARQLAAALDEARRMHVVHRDLKGTNVMVTASGAVKVLDFGLATIASPNSSGPRLVRDTDPGHMLGTPEYRSPEQTLRRAVDHRSDLFSLGVMLYELITGTLPFRGSTRMELFWSIVNRHPAPIEETIPDVPADLSQIVSKLLEKDTRHRYQTARQVLVDLERERITDEHQQTERALRQRQWIRRVAGSSVGIMAAWALMPIAFAVSALVDNVIESNLFMAGSVWAGTDQIHDLKSVSEPAINPSAAWISNDGRVVYNTRRRHGGGALWVVGDGQPPRMITRDANEAAVGPLGQYVYFTRDGFEGGLFRTPLDPKPGQLPIRLAAGPIAHPVVSPDGSRIVFARLGVHGFSVWSVPTIAGDAYPLSSYFSAVPAIVSPDLRRMAIEQANGVLVCDIAGCTGQRLVPVTSVVGWTPDSTGLTHTGAPASSNIWVTRIATGTETQITRFTEQVVTSISWSPNGHRLAVTRQRSLTDLAWFNALR
jgi:serine/threonine protein kinase